MTALPQPVVGKPPNGGRFDFDDGGTYCGGWEDGKAHGHGVCTGPKGQGEYCGSWHFGFEVSGTYTWPSGSTYDGQWQNGKRHGLGVESRGRWVYRGEWTQGFKGRYGVRQSTTSVAKYEGTWANGLQDGYGSETYADTGTYKGQWLRGLRHGYGVRTSAQYSQASVSRHKGNTKGSSSSLRSDGTGDPLADRDKKIDDGRGGFVLRARSDDIRRRRGSLSDKSNFRNVFKGLKIRRQRSTGDIGTGGRQTGSIRSNSSSTSWMSTESGQSAYTVGDVPEDGSNASFIVEDEQLDGSVTETYLGEWKNDKRTGFGACERSDGIRYEGEWYNNKKYGYGVTTFKDGSKEEGKYKNNVLITSNKKKHVFLIRSAKFRERIEAAVAAAQRASKIAMQKEDIAISRTATARGKAEQADIAAIHATEDSDLARIFARQFAPDFIQPGVDFVKVSSKSHKPHHADINNKVGNSRAKNNPNSHNNHKPNSIHRNSDIMMTDDFPKRDHEQEMLHQDDDNCPNFDRDSLDNEYDSSNHTNTRLDNSLSHIPSRKNSTLSDSYDHHNRATIRGSRSQVRDVVGRASNNVQNDRFDHYNRPPSRPPSRDRSVDRYNSRGQTPVSSSAEQSYIRPRVAVPSSSQKAQDWTPDSGVFEDEVSTAPTVSSRRSSRHTAPISEENTPPLTGNGCIGGGGARHLYNIPSNQKEAEVFLRQRACGQEIPLVPAPGGPFKRTESLYINPIIRKQAQMKQSPVGNSTSLKRKKSLPEVQQIDDSTPIMPREEAAALSSQQRHIVRQRAEESEKYRANPLLYLTSPSVQDWFSKQRLVMLILFLNLSLALMFFKLLS